MSNSNIENVDLGNVILQGVADHDDIIFDTATRTIPAGTIFARNSTTLKLVPFVKGGATLGNGIPKVVLTYNVDVITGVDKPVRVMQVGKVNFNRLIIDADGDNSNIDKTVMDELRDYGIETAAVKDLSVLDNQ